MSKSNVVLFYDLCRLCLDNVGKCSISESSDLLEDIYLCTSVKVTGSDNLPQKICVKCLEVVKQTKELRILAIKNDEHLRSLFNDDSEEDIIKNNTCNISLSNNNNKSTLFENDVKDNKKAENENLTEFAPIIIKTESASPEFAPVIIKTESVKKELFPGSSPGSITPVKQKSKTKTTNNNEALLIKKIKIESEDLYECGMCSKVFDKWKKLYLHQRSHNKSVVCPFDACSKKFTTKGDLAKHVRVHTGERPYVCEKCARGFAQRVQLRYHRETAHSKSSDEDE